MTSRKPHELSSGPHASTWSRLGPLLGKRRGSIALLAAGSVLSGITEAGVLAILAQVAAALVDGTSQVRIDVGPLHMDQTVGALLAVGFALTLVRLGLQVLVSVLPARIAADVQERVRSDLFAAFTRASWDVQSRDREGQLQELATSQATQAAQSALQATILMVALLTFLALLVSALALNIVAALLVLVTASSLFILLRPLNRLGSRSAQALSRVAIDYAGGINEAVRVAEETQVFGVDVAQREQIDRHIASVRALFFRTQLLIRLGPSVYQSLAYVLVVVALAGLYATGTEEVASLGAVILLLIRAGAYGQQAQAAYQSMRQALPFLDRLEDARHRYVASTPTAGEQRLGVIRSLTFENVQFAYEPGRPVLLDITFEIAGGEAIGIVGPSGAGKSTLVQILLGLRVPTGGRYLVNGVVAEEYTRKDWHGRVAYVPQEPRLLHASVSDNIRFFRELDDATVERAARLAGIHDDVMKWTAGYDTIVGPRADAISGGQQQRIALARALAAQPQLLVLDEPTSALDPHSEALIQESLDTLKHELTMFIVAHRMSTLDICERAMVIVDGRLEALDTVSRLRSSNAYYRFASAVSAK